MNINTYLKEHPRNCSRGAPMGADCGRPDYEPAYLQQVHLDQQGYAPDGAYWGTGQLLWCLFDSGMPYQRYVRAVNRAEAFTKFNAIFGGIKLINKVRKP